MTEPSGYTAVGMVGFTDKGTYSASASYVKNDLVHYGGSVWCCLIDDTTGITPTEGTNWTLFVGEPTNMAERIIAPLEVSPSENAYSVGEQLIFNDVLYKAKTAIAVGDALVVDTNIEVAPKISSQIQTLTNETATINNVLGAKNLLPNNATTQIINSVQFTVNANGSVGVNRVGTSSSNATIDICSSLEISSPSILSGCPIGGGLNEHALIATDGTNYYSDTGDGVEIPAGTYRVYILIYSSSTISNKTFYPMIRPSSIVDSTYVPYAMTNRELTEAAKANKPFAVDTGISGVTAWKSGNMVTLMLYCPVNGTTSGWKELGVLPKELRPPITNLYFAGYDNNVSSYNMNVVQDCAVTSEGKLNVYLFPDKLSIRLSATVTYPTLN